MGQKVNRLPFFFSIFNKKDCSHAHIFLKNIYSLKNTLLIFIYYVKKCPFSQRHYAFIPFFSIFLEKPSVAMLSGQKNVNSVKTTLYYVLWAKNFNKMSFFPIFHEKYLLSCPCIVKTTSTL